MRKRSWIAYAVACALGLGVASTTQAQNRYYFQGPFGPGGTYNLYELKGIGDLTVTPGQHFGRYVVENAAPLTLNTGPGALWWDAQDAAAATTENISGTNKPAHLTAFSGATAKAENDFVHQQSFFGDVWIGLSDDEAIGHGAAETGTGDPVADSQRGLNNAAPGWRWTNGEVYDFGTNWGGGEPNNCCTGGEDAAHIRGDGLWNDNGDGRDGEGTPAFKYVYEYETHTAAPLNIPNSIKLSAEAQPTPGGTGGLGTVSVREVHSPNTVSGNAGALDLLNGVLPKDAEVNYTATTINKNGLSGGAGGGNFNGDTDWGLVTEGALAPGDINNFAYRASGYIRVPAGQGGDYTFSVNTDDSGELWIYDADFASVTNGTRSAYGSIAFLGDRGASDTLGVVHLDGNKDYKFEYVMNENGGGASAELSAAKGAFTAFSPLDFKLVGGDPTATNYSGGTTPHTTGDYTIKEVLRLEVGSGPLNTLADAKALLNSPDGNDLVFNGTSPTVNHSDETTNGTASGRFGNDSNFLNDTFNNPPDFDDDDFVFNAKTQVVITTAGDYTFGFDSDDGAEIILQGANFTNSFGPAVANGDHLTADILTGSSLSAGWTHLEPGTYNLEYTMFERGGGSFAELFVAPGRAPGFSTDLFELLSPTSGRVVGPRFIAGALQFGDGSLTGETGQVGDTDNDGDVDLTDLNNVRNNFGGAGLGDTDGDNDVDLDDLNSVRNNFGAGGSNSVPEPSSLALIGLGLAGLFGIRKFRK